MLGGLDVSRLAETAARLEARLAAVESALGQLGGLQQVVVRLEAAEEAAAKRLEAMSSVCDRLEALHSKYESSLVVSAPD